MRHRPTHALILAGATAVLLVAFSGTGSAAELVLHVDPAQAGAGDANDGGEAAPLATIGEAVRRALADDGHADAVTILVHPGLYRESVRLDFAERARRVALRSTVPGGAVISGAEPLGDWTRLGPTLFRAPLRDPPAKSVRPPEWPKGVTVKEPVLRREVLFVDGQPMRQIYENRMLEPGSFQVNEDQGALVLRPPTGVDPTAAATAVELARRDVLLSVAKGRGVVVDGFTIERASTPFMASAVDVAASDDVTLKGLTIRDNNASGLGIGESSNVVLEGNRILHNGSTGVGIWRVDGLVARDTRIEGNNWRGVSGGFIDWAVAGMKLLQVHNGRIDGLQVLDNAAAGLWLDTDIADLTVENAELTANRGPGLITEAVQGPVSITASRIVGNGEGVVAAGAERIALSDSVVACNHQSQLNISGAQDRPVTDHHDGTVTTVNNENWSLSGLTVAATRRQSPLISTTLPQAYWDRFLGTLKSQGNTWRHTDNSKPFRGPWGIGATFDAWRSRIGESGSRFESTATSPCANTRAPAGADAP